MVKLMLKKIINNKSGISEMLSYIILVAMVMGLAMAVFAWLRVMSTTTQTADCEDGTSISLDNSSCDGYSITFVLRNNGRFNISGVTITVGNDSQISPSTYLKDRAIVFGGAGSYGTHLFLPEIDPGNTQNITFENLSKTGTLNFNTIRVVQIQPFILSNNEKIYCTNSVIKQTISDCII